MGNHAWLMGFGWGCWDRNSGLLGWGSSTVNHSLLSSSEELLTIFLGMLAIIPYRTNLKPLFLFLYISPLFVCCVWQCFLPCVMQRHFSSVASVQVWWEAVYVGQRTLSQETCFSYQHWESVCFVLKKYVNGWWSNAEGFKTHFKDLLSLPASSLRAPKR